MDQSPLSSCSSTSLSPLCAIPRMVRCFNHRPSWIEAIHDVLLLDKVEGADLAEDPGKIIVELLSGN